MKWYLQQIEKSSSLPTIPETTLSECPKAGKSCLLMAMNFPVGMDLTIGGVKGDEFLLVTDTDRHQFFKTTLDGKIIKSWNYPRESEKYQNESEFVPTETAVTSNGEIYVADGYGAQYIYIMEQMEK
jgi:peptidylamidoglycolate lyase